MKKKTKIVIGIFLVVVICIAYYGLSPLWRTTTINESTPTDTSAVVSARPIIDTVAHPASGTVSLLQKGDEVIVRYENFKTINGPDLRVYLSTDLEATEFVDLGPLKATDGNVNYSVPSGTNMDKYHYVLVWCEQFGVLFNSADLQL